MNKICFVITSLSSGGIENYLLRFLESYSTLIESVVFCKSGKFGVLEKKFTALKNVSIEKRSIKYHSIKSLYFLHGFFRKEKFDCVCDFTGDFGGPLMLISKIAGINKRIVFYRESRYQFKETIIKLVYCRFVHMLVKYFATDVLSNSISAFDYFFKYNWRIDKRFEVIYNGVNIETLTKDETSFREELNIPNIAFVVGHMGRFTKAKNHETVLKVASNIVSTNPDIYFILCGKGVDDALFDKVKSHNLDSRIKIFGNIENVSKFLNTIDCFYLPSLSEGQPNALIEAMLLGIPFVASNIDSIKETVPSDYFDFLVKPKDYISAKRLILNTYSNNTNRVIPLSKYARERFGSGVLFEKFFMKLVN